MIADTPPTPLVRVATKPTHGIGSAVIAAKAGFGFSIPRRMAGCKRTTDRFWFDAADKTANPTSPMVIVTFWCSE